MVRRRSRKLEDHGFNPHSRLARSRCKSRCKFHVEMSWDLQNIHIVTLGNGHLMSSTPARKNLDSTNTVIEDTQDFNN